MSLFQDIGIGAATGGLYNVGKAAGFFGGGQGPDFGNIQDVINQRQSQIDDFSNRLDAARNNVLSNYKNLQTNTMNKFMPLYEARLAGRGLSASGGAFASGVANEATNLESHYNDLNTSMTESNLNSVENARASLFAPQMGLAENESMLPYAQRQSRQAMFGKLAGGAVGSIFGPAGAAIGSNIGGLFSSSPATSETPTQNTNPFARQWWNSNNSPAGGQP